MLSRLETLYLNILRVVILVVATGLLVGAVIGAVAAAPLLMSSFSRPVAARVANDTLEDYLREQSGQAAAEAGASGEATVEAQTIQTDKRIKQAADNLAAYVQKTTGGVIVAQAVVDFIEQRATSLPEGMFDRYADSLLALSRQLLKQPQGQTPADLDDLINWHFGKFISAVEQAEIKAAQEEAAAAQRKIMAMAAASLAAILFGLFLFTVFVFVAVKIERNLRLLPVKMDQTPRSP